MDIETRLARLEARNTKLAIFCGALVVLCMGLGATFAVAGPTRGQPDVIHAKGLVIEDAYGHPRILIGVGVGIILHDTEGNERGGMSWLSNGRGSIAFDYPERDAIGMYVDDKDRSATFVLVIG